MSPRIPEPTLKPRERAIIIGLDIKGKNSILPIQESLDELELLSKTAGLVVVERMWQSLVNPNPKTFIGKGKVEEAENLANDSHADVIIFDDELSPRHQRELEKAFGDKFKIIDRTALILDIFAQHADTREGALQVELAQCEYRLPRLTRAWTHLARQAGGGGGRTGGGGVGLRGPGETQLEADRREINRKISFLKKEIAKVQAHRARHRVRRKKAQLPVIALVGYTNAGKSTLLNSLSDSNVYVDNKLFATLDPVTRKVILPNGETILFTDTVGFIQKLPTTLVAAFKATLEEIIEADLLLHVVDSSHKDKHAHINAVNQTLLDIGAKDIPVILVWNKIDIAQTYEATRFSTGDDFSKVEHEISISALRSEGLEELLKLVEDKLYKQFKEYELFVPYTEGKLISLINTYAIIEQSEHRDIGIYYKCAIPGRYETELIGFDI